MIPVVTGFLPRRRPEPEPDLLAESGQRAGAAYRAAREQLGHSTAVAGKWFELPATRAWPDPYGPDPVVFGSEPRAAGW